MSYLKAKREAPYPSPSPPSSSQRTKRSCALGFVIDSRYKKWFIRTRQGQLLGGLRVALLPLLATNLICCYIAGQTVGLGLCCCPLLQRLLQRLLQLSYDLS